MFPSPCTGAGRNTDCRPNAFSEEPALFNALLTNNSSNCTVLQEFATRVVQETNEQWEKLIKQQDTYGNICRSVRAPICGDPLPNVCCCAV